MKKILSYVGLLLAVIFVFIGFSTQITRASDPYSLGNVLINEFVINTSPGTAQWYELMNNTDTDIDLTSWIFDSAINGTSTIDTLLGTSSKLLPARGLLTISIPYTPGDDAGDVLQIKSPSGTSIHAVSYGNQPNPPAPNHVTAPTSAQSAILTGTSTPVWSTTTTITRGWYNEGPAPTIASIVSDINAGGVVTNMGDLSDPSAATDLYFEKRTDISSSTTALGKLTFAGPLNLTNSSTTALLQDLGNKMEVAAGSMNFDARMAEDLRTAGASVSMYNINNIGYDVSTLSTSSLTVTDDLGVEIATSSIDYPDLSGVSTSSANGGTFIFTTNHFTGFGFDPELAEVTPVASTTASTSPYYTYSSNVAGTAIYGGDCAMASASTTIGNNTIQFGPLTPATYSNCTVKVIDGAGASSTLAVTSFTIESGVPTEVWVDDDYTSTSTGSHTWDVDAFATIQEGIDAVEVGGTVNVAAGTYTEDVDITKQISLIGDIGTDAVGPGENAPIITNNTSNRTVNIDASGVIFRGFVVENTDNYPDVRIAPEISSSTVKNNELRNSYSGVGLAPGANNNLITKNKLHDNYYGIKIGGAINNNISYNDIYENDTNGILFTYSNYFGSVYTVGGNSINHNTISSSTGDGIYIDDSLDTTAGNVLIDSNTISGSGAAGIYIDSGTSDISITSNTISNNGLTEGLSTGIHVVSASGNSAHNNIIGDDAYGTGIYNEDSEYFNATQNYWGTSTGPYENGVNDLGNQNSEVVGNVTYTPWYSDEEMTSLRGIPTVNEGIATYTVTEEFISTSTDYDLEMASGTEVTGTSTWTGEINPPTVTTLSSAPSRTGYTTTMGEIIEVGFAGSKLTLSKAAKLTFTGEHGKKIGYTRPGESFTEITTTCGANTQIWADANLGTEGDCKVDSGDDLVVWTKHFTTFATYTQTQNRTSSNGGGNGGSITNQVNNLLTAGKIAEAEALIKQWPTLFPNYVFKTATSTSAVTPVLKAGYRFANDLKLGSVGPEVVELQKFLVSQGYLVMPVGTAMGEFGPRTKAALIKYQQANKITPASGNFGPMTRTKINEIAKSVSVKDFVDLLILLGIVSSDKAALVGTLSL